MLVIIVAVFLAYNANNGLPFVSTYDLKARVPNADALVKGNEVRIGGARVGVVKSVVAGPAEERQGRGRTHASASTRAPNRSRTTRPSVIRPKSPLGLKYLQIIPGQLDERLQGRRNDPGQRCATPEPVDIDQFFDMFDEPTRLRDPRTWRASATRFAGRGPQLNEALGALRETGRIRPSRPLRNLVAPCDRLRRLLAGARGAHGDGRPGRADNRRAVRRPRPDLRRLRPRLPPLHPGNDRQRPADARHGERRPAGDQPLPARHRALLRRLAAGGESARRNLAVSLESLHAGDPGAERDRRSSTPSCCRPPKRCSPSRKPQGVFNGLDLLTDTNEEPRTRRSGSSPRRRPTCNYLTLTFRKPRQRLQRGQRATAIWLGRHLLRSRRKGRTARPARPRRRQRRRRRVQANHLHYNPLPEHRRARASRADAKPATRSTHAGKTVIGNAPGDQGTDHRRPAEPGQVMARSEEKKANSRRSSVASRQRG